MAKPPSRIAMKKMMRPTQPALTLANLPTLEPDSKLDAALLALVEEAITEELAGRVLQERYLETDEDEPPHLFERSMQRLEAAADMPAQTAAGLGAKARLLLTHMPEIDPFSQSERCDRLSLSIARDAARLGAAALPTITTPDPILAAVAASRAALDAHIVACASPDADTPDGDARRTAAGQTAHATWRTLLAMKPTTFAGAQALALRAVDQLERGGCWNDSNDQEDARTLFRAIAAAGPAGIAPELHMSSRGRHPAAAPIPMAAE